MQKILIVLALASLVSYVVADTDFYQSLKASVEETKKALSKQQLEELNGVREELDDFEDFKIDEPMFSADAQHYDVAIRIYLIGRRQINNKEEFEQKFTDLCKTVNQIWAQTFSDFYSKQSTGSLSYHDIKNHENQENFDMLLNASVCYNGYNHNSI